jgi:hypothetical protein
MLPDLGSNILGELLLSRAPEFLHTSFRQITKFSLTVSARPILRAAIVRLLAFEDEIKPPNEIGIH